MSNASVAVYKGGEVTLRYHFMQQRLGDLKVDHHEARLGFSYTPAPRPQFEEEVPYHIFTQGSASAHNSGNVIGWIEYRFYNSLETREDRQAAIRVGIESPTASKNTVGDPATNEAEFLRRQLLRIDGGLSTQVDAVYSRAKRRFVYGASVDGLIRREFVGVRMGDGRGSGVRPPAAKLSKTRIAGTQRYIPAGKSNADQAAGRQVPNKLPAPVRDSPDRRALRSNERPAGDSHRRTLRKDRWAYR
jgi:hypothetical protein